METVAIIAMIIIFAIRELSHHLHDTRRDNLISELTDKIKAKDFTEYVEQTKTIQTFEPVSMTDERQYWAEIEEMKQ